MTQGEAAAWSCSGSIWLAPRGSTAWRQRAHRARSVCVAAVWDDAAETTAVTAAGQEARVEPEAPEGRVRVRDGVGGSSRPLGQDAR